ncbi:MAG: hypothetical protein HRT45_07905 [Bdellovibrionales bacterium]|nr:hypothetical protein [Bdellovibrionales bacterium]
MSDYAPIGFEQSYRQADVAVRAKLTSKTSFIVLQTYKGEALKSYSWLPTGDIGEEADYTGDEALVFSQSCKLSDGIKIIHDLLFS